MKVENLEVFGFERCVVASGYAMHETKDKKTDYTKDIKRAVNLAKPPSNSGHPNFITGIRVMFDLTIPVTMLVQVERYHWFDIVTCQSTMHKLNKFDLSNSFTDNTDSVIIERLQVLIDDYNREPNSVKFQVIADSCPKGIELKMLISTNYMQLRNMIQQRKNHRLDVWKEFCEYMMNNLPMAKEFLGVNDEW